TKYFGDPIDATDRGEFRKEEVYLNEYDKLPEIIAPTQFAGGHWGYVLLRCVWDWPKLPSAEDVWLAVEDLCVQRELLKNIRDVNQMFAVFLPEPNPDDPKYRIAPDFDEKEVAQLKGQVPEGDPAEAAKKLQALLTEKRAAKEKELKKQLKDDQEKVTKELQALFQPKEGETVGRFISPYWQLDLAV